jgi:threonine dehydratase
MANGAEVEVDGSPNGSTHTPRTPSLNGFSLTEYAANPTPPRGKSPQQHSVVPEDYRLPNGTPDVCKVIEILLRIHD